MDAKNKKLTSKSPYLSIVLAARNDNYGGHFLQRIKVFFKVLFYQIKTYDLSCEIIVVEWNPPSNTPQLHQTLGKLLKSATTTVRFIEVPRYLHKQFPNYRKIPMFEYIAKNVGIRRARGKYVLVTNPDILFPENLIKFLSAESLDESYFYRIDRCDVNNLIPFKKDVKKQISFAKKHSFRLHTFGESVSLLTLLPFKLRISIVYFKKRMFFFQPKDSKRIEDKLHVNAAGDFMLMTRKNLCALRGFPELPSYCIIDGYLCCMAKSYGLKQKILSPPLFIFHSEHDRPTDRPWTSYHDWIKDCQVMLAKKKPQQFNKSTWGLKAENLKEHLFSANE